MKSISPNLFFFIQFIGNGKQKGMLGDGLMKCRIKNGCLRGVLENFSGNFYSFQVGRIVKGCQRNILFYGSNDRVINDAGRVKAFSAMHDPVPCRPEIEPGCLGIYFTPDWAPLVQDIHESYGHNIETAQFLIEAARSLGRPEDPPTWAAARGLVDRALERGWDDRHGGLFERGEPGGAGSASRVSHPVRAPVFPLWSRSA